jgi:hypothetical protein
MCVSTCTTTTPFIGFFLSGTASPSPFSPVPATTGTLPSNAGCTYDFLAIVGGFDPITGVISDRYCGGSLASASVCSMSIYRPAILILITEHEIILKIRSQNETI